jgi:hypothetical protein
MQTQSQQRTGTVSRLFHEHPRSLGMSWWDHGVGAVKIGAELVTAGGACMIHAIVPGWFTQTAGRTVERLHRHMLQRRAGAANPNDWPDYEI